MVFNCRLGRHDMFDLHDAVRRRNRLEPQARCLEVLVKKLGDLKIDDKIGAAKTAPAYRCGLLVVTHEDLFGLDRLIDEIADHTTEFVHWNTYNALLEKFLIQYRQLSTRCESSVLERLRSADFKDGIRNKLVEPGTVFLQAIWVDSTMEVIETEGIVIDGVPPNITSSFHKRSMRDDTVGIRHEPPHPKFLFSNYTGLQETVQNGTGGLWLKLNEMRAELRELERDVEEGCTKLVREFLNEGTTTGASLLGEDVGNLSGDLSEYWRAMLDGRSVGRMLWVVGMWVNREEFSWCQGCVSDGIKELLESWDSGFPSPGLKESAGPVCYAHQEGYDGTVWEDGYDGRLSAHNTLEWVKRALRELDAPTAGIEAVVIPRSLLEKEIEDFLVRGGELVLSIHE